MDRNAWEIVRDLDRFRAIATGDTKLIVHLYFGTPFENFRNKLLEDFRNPVKIPDEYLWTLNGEKPTQLVFNLLKAEVEGKKFRLKSGQVIHRMLSILCSDFYRPFRVPGLFNSIFPGEHLNPRIAPSRIHQTVMRLRRWCKSSMFPLLIKENDGKYHLSASSPCSIRINRTEILGQGAKVVRLHIVKRALPKNEFSVHEVINILQVSRNSALRLLDEARKEGKVVRISGGPSTKYRFVA